MTARFLWKLVFQSGSLFGQELHLPAGKLTVGMGTEWDIDLLLPESKSGEHCVLCVEDAGVTLQPLQMRCKVDGRPMKSDQILLRAGQVVEVGGCAFMLAQAGARTEAAASARRGWRAWKGIWGVVLPGGLAAGILAALLYASQELRASVPLPAHELFSVERYRQALHQTGLSQVNVERDEMGVLTLKGRCWQSDTLEPFLNQLIQAEVSYRNQVICQDALQRSVAYVLSAHGYRYARVASGPTLGSVAISGNIHADQRWSLVSRQFNQLPGLQSWSVTNDADQSMTTLVSALREKGLLAKLSVVRQDDILMVTGQLADAQRQTLQQILISYQQQQTEPMRVVYQAIPASEQEAGIFPAAIVSFSGNSQSASLQLANGIKVQAGSTLPSGYTITGLDRTGVELQKEGQLMHLPLGL